MRVKQMPAQAVRRSVQTAVTEFLAADGSRTAGEPFEVEVTHVPLSGRTELDLALIPTGTFVMGSVGPDAYPDERPLHLVHVRSFYLGRMTVTQAQWQAVMKRLPPCRGKEPDMPVDRVSFLDCRRFIDRLSALTAIPFRFPAEAEWEYACRARTRTEFPFGDAITTEVCNYVGSYQYAREPPGEYRHGPVRADSFAPNGFGLHQMPGNLWEWCEDIWHDDYTGAPLDGSPWTSGSSPERVLRGGSWHDPPRLCRSASRLKLAPTEGEDFVGLRVAVSLDGLRDHVESEAG